MHIPMIPYKAAFVVYQGSHFNLYLAVQVGQ